MAGAVSVIDFHPDFIEAVEAQAAFEAAGVADLLESMGIRARSDSDGPPTVYFTAGSLLAIGVMLRFSIWERDGAHFHLDAGLPSSSEVLVQFLRIESVEGRDVFVQHLHATSLQLFHDHFVWLAKTESLVNLGFQGPLDDEQIRVIADYLWDNRHALCEGDEA